MSTTDPSVTTEVALDGVLAGPIRGLRFATPTISGLTDERGGFRYRRGESATFLIGGIVLGSVEGAPRITLAQLIDRSDGKIDRLHDPMVTNLARLVQTLDQDGDLEDGITISPAVHELIGHGVINFNQAATDAKPDDAAPSGAGGAGTAAMVAFSTESFQHEPCF